MDQMNVSMTDHLASYVRKKVKSGRYNNASEVVRDVVRRMEEEEARESQLAQSQEESLPANLAGEQRESIRRLVRKRLESAEPANSVEYMGRDGLRHLAARVKARGRKATGKTLKSTAR